MRLVAIFLFLINFYTSVNVCAAAHQAPQEALPMAAFHVVEGFYDVTEEEISLEVICVMPDADLRTFLQNYLGARVRLVRRLVVRNYPALATVAGGYFSMLNYLTDLDLSNNALAALPWNIFEGLPNLRWLSLAHNELRTIPDRLFDELGGLVFLDMSHNQLGLRSFSLGCFQQLQNLIILDLIRNRDLFWENFSFNWTALRRNCYLILAERINPDIRITWV